MDCIIVAIVMILVAIGQGLAKAFPSSNNGRGGSGGGYDE